MNDSVNANHLAHEDSTQAVMPPVRPLLGALLLDARERHNLTIEDVSNRLRLSLRQIKALESDDFSALPEATTTRGFIRNYARLLDIDAEPLLEAYRAYVPSESPHAISIHSENILISGSDRQPWQIYIVASLLIALLVGIWLVYTEYTSRQPAQKAASVGQSATAEHSASSEQSSSNEPLPVPALPASERGPEVTSSVDIPLPTTNTATATNAATATAPAPAPAPVAESGNVAAGSVSNQTQPATTVPAKLKFTFSDHTWVNVIDRNNKEILNKNKSAGSEETVEGQPPFKIIIGNAAGSKLVFNDKPVDLAPHTKLNVARLTLE